MHQCTGISQGSRSCTKIPRRFNKKLKGQQSNCSIPQLVDDVWGLYKHYKHKCEPNRGFSHSLDLRQLHPSTSKPCANWCETQLTRIWIKALTIALEV